MKYSSLSCDELVRACGESGETEAWQEFLNRFDKTIVMTVWRIARRFGMRDSGIVKDLVQDTYAKICEQDCRVLREFVPQHQDAFLGLLKVTAASVVHDYFRSRNSDKRGSGQIDSELSAAETFAPVVQRGPDLLERRILMQQIDEALCDLGTVQRDREIFWLHYRQGLTASDIANIAGFGLGAKGVESILHRLRSQLRKRLVEAGAVGGEMAPSQEGTRRQKSLSIGEQQ